MNAAAMRGLPDDQDWNWRMLSLFAWVTSGDPKGWFEILLSDMPEKPLGCRILKVNKFS